MRHYEVTHGTLADGETQKKRLDDGNVSVGRFGMFNYYRFSTACSACRFHLSPVSRPEVRLVFVSTGSDIHVGNDGEVKVFSVGECDCALVKEGCAQEITVHGDGECELFMLVVDLSERSLPITDSPPHLRNFLTAGKCTWLFEGQDMVLGMRKIAVIQQIFRERKPAYLQYAYMQLKLTELLVLFLEKAGGFGKNGAATKLRPEDVERMRRVKDLLYEQPAGSYSLAGLARAAGTNEATLKRNFKMVYGTTVFGYLTARRMELAKTLLLAKELKVAAVAQEVGYKYASHFTSAFRKHFGVLPNKLLRMVVPMPLCSALMELEAAIAPFLLVG